MEQLQWTFSSIVIILLCTITMISLANTNFYSFSKKKQLLFTIFYTLFLCSNVLVQILLGFELYGDLYIIFTQIPLLLFLFFVTRYRGLQLIFLYMSTIIFSSGAMMLSSILIYFTKLPFLSIFTSYCLMFLVSSKLLKKPFYYILEYADSKFIGLLTILPLLYYFYNYYATKYQYFTIMTTINHDFWERAMTLAIVIFSYYINIVFFKTQIEKTNLNSVQQMISQQLHDATNQIQQLRHLEKHASMYRHDMRHHFNYINSCIQQNKPEEATDYIQQIVTVFENSQIVTYSSNESINMMISSFKTEAEEQNINFSVHAPAMDFNRFAIIDLCKLLYNGIENAIHACQQIEDISRRNIHIELYEKNQKLCLEIKNSYETEPSFNEKGIPISIRNGHGIGVKSMIYVVEKYEGIYKFSTKDGFFLFQVSM
ncbi:MAG: GHKL domain-containing protein [Lachnospiraceae bacterium]|nr:GHKL domain-containing protein [Lachnospiraceae bacterium]